MNGLSFPQRLEVEVAVVGVVGPLNKEPTPLLLFVVEDQLKNSVEICDESDPVPIPDSHRSDSSILEKKESGQILETCINKKIALLFPKIQ